MTLIRFSAVQLWKWCDAMAWVSRACNYASCRRPHRPIAALKLIMNLLPPGREDVRRHNDSSSESARVPRVPLGIKPYYKSASKALETALVEPCKPDFQSKNYPCCSDELDLLSGGFTLEMAWCHVLDVSGM